MRRDPRHGNGLQVTVVDEGLPFPLDSGKRIRTFNLLRPLADRHRITILAYAEADPEATRRAVAFLETHGIDSVVVDRVLPRAAGPAFAGRLAWNLLSTRPYSVQIHNSRQLQAAIGHHAASRQVDLWQCEWTPYGESLCGRVAAPWLIMAHNVESLIWQRYHETERQPFKRWYIRHQWHKFARFERRMFAATRTIAVSDGDAALARSQFDARQVDVVENGVDTTYFQPDDSPRDPNRIVFLGSLDWRPNLDAVRLLLDSVMPSVLAQEPRARLALVGRRPPRWLVERAQASEGVELHPDVPDVRPFLRQSGVMVVPLRIGGGSRLKIVEALASECPVISTRIGAEGLDLTPGEHLVEVESVDQLAAALVDHLRQPQRLRDMGVRGRILVAERYDWRILSLKLETIWQDQVRAGALAAGT
jgi:glycosyltransferase involved in cell wall biosynthesis